MATNALQEKKINDYLTAATAVDDLPDIIKNFVLKLETIEQDKSSAIEPLISLFEENVHISTPVLENPLEGREGAQQFWQSYRQQFNKISSKYTRTINLGNVAILEWVSHGKLMDRTPFKYAGVSLITHNGKQITDFRTYFDSAALIGQSRHRQSTEEREGASSA